MSSLAAYTLAAFAEIGGCFAFWAWLRLGKPVWWLGPGVACLILFAWTLTRVEAEFAGRAYAAYGGIYVLASLVWLWLVEGARPDRWDAAGVLLCVLETLVILFGPRASG